MSTVGASLIVPPFITVNTISLGAELAVYILGCVLFALGLTRFSGLSALEYKTTNADEIFQVKGASKKVNKMLASASDEYKQKIEPYLASMESYLLQENPTHKESIQA